MKVGLLTFHYNCNFGAVLQCLALQSAVEALGFDAHVLDYRPPSAPPPPVWRGWGLRRGQFIPNLRKRVHRMRHGAAMRVAFDAFRQQHLHMTRPCSSPSELAECCAGLDAIIVGSDQVWNHAKSPVYFLDGLGPSFVGRRISYAACFGQPEQADLPELEGIPDWLARFDAVSTRNQFSADLVKRYSGPVGPVVADPSLLADLRRCEQPVPGVPEPYILLYALSGPIPGGDRLVIDEIRRHHGPLPVLAINPSLHTPQLYSVVDQQFSRLGPGQWHSLLRHAAFVVTDSFHGAAYAMKFAKPFLAYYRDPARSHRLLDLANRYGAEARIVPSAEVALASGVLRDSGFPAAVSRKIDEHVRTSLTFLQNAIVGGGA